MYDGNVVLCCADCYNGTSIGNVLHEPIEHILESGRRENIIEKLLNGKRSEFTCCQDCYYGISEEIIADDLEVDRNSINEWLSHRYPVKYFDNEKLTATELVNKDDDKKELYSNPFINLRSRITRKTVVNQENFQLTPAFYGRLNEYQHLADLEIAKSKKHWDPIKNTLLVVGDFDVLKTINTDMDFYEQIRNHLNHEWNVILDPNKTHTLLACCKRIHEWIYAAPEAIILWFSAYNIRNNNKIINDDIHMDILQHRLEYILWKILAHLNIEISIVLPPVNSAIRFWKTDSQRGCNLFSFAQKRVIYVAEKVGCNIINLSHFNEHDMMTTILPSLVKNCLHRK